jgi:DNA-directed RNA polymerase specialized sigma24 family protein
VESPNEAAVAKFIQEDYERVVNAVALVAGSLPAAQDAAQEALARAWIRSKRASRSVGSRLG